MNVFPTANAQPYALPASPSAVPGSSNGAMPQAAPDPLAQLADIHLPPAVEGFPWAIGWWGVLAVSLTVLLLLAIFLWRWYRANEFKRDAKAELASIITSYQESSDKEQCYQQINQLLRRVVLHKDSASVSLTGQSWAEYLARQGRGSLTEEQTQLLLQAAYQPSPADPSPLFPALETWLKRYREPARA
jgi:hypothetical protein